MSHILLIDDDTELCDLLTEYLQGENFTLSVVHDGQQGADLAMDDYDLVILDVMLPNLNGLEVLKKIRSNSHIPARIRAIQRRTEANTVAPANNHITVGDITLSLAARQCYLNQDALKLTSVEFSLLEALLLKAGQVINREDLVIQVLGRDLSPYDRSIDVHISNLRKKLGYHSDNSERIKTIRSIGYLYTVAQTMEPQHA
ncbi:MAG: response regulator transcription factor [Deltaproteobacteria bacterium]|nr:response regulator transcription factor [Deltaproteobacteria bacterium]